ncbi:hypothetical protein Anas_11454 [Armadillidium nasatum]|uniref:LIM zinc-binding domain-containing protein n=1 Tax=Armadillidium nasatum TaxID=96803 RepID=A0A5N5T4F8_9CRUS|nr:hypothetical protein Anas_11454 [Armadillidium nasatum]
MDMLERASEKFINNVDHRQILPWKCIPFAAERTGRHSICIGCTGIINDQYILRVAPDMEWHAACLKCADCQQVHIEDLPGGGARRP